MLRSKQIIVLSIFSLVAFALSFWSDNFLLLSTFCFGAFNNQYLLFMREKTSPIIHKKYSFMNIVVKSADIWDTIFPQQNRGIEVAKRSLFPLLFVSLLHLIFQIESAPFFSLWGSLTMEVIYYAYTGLNRAFCKRYR